MRTMSNNEEVTTSEVNVKCDRAAAITRRQLVILVFLCYGNFCNNACYSLIGPFYPKVAETKGKSSFLFANYSDAIQK